MIDFRYHLVSIVAVLLALSVGVILGTGALGGPLLEDIDRNVEDLRSTNARLQEEVNATHNRLDAERAFSAEVEPFVVQGLLDGTDVVIVEIAGTDGSVADRMRNSIGLAGGAVSVTVEILDRFTLESTTDADQLALAIGSIGSEPEQLIEEAGRLFGQRLAQSLLGRGVGVDGLIEDLRSADFVDVEDVGDTPPFPEGASVLIVGGGPDEPPYDVAAFTLAASRELGEAEIPVLVAEPTDSMWGMVSAVRNDGAARDIVSTVDGVSEVFGRVATIMALERMPSEEALHLGRLPGAEDLLPPATPEE